eukprot:1101524-Amphidinium_carterae.1
MAVASFFGIEAPIIEGDTYKDVMNVPAYCLRSADTKDAQPICTAQQRSSDSPESLIEISIMCQRQKEEALHHVCAALAIMSAEHEVVDSESQNGLVASAYSWRHAMAFIVFCMQGVVCLWSAWRFRKLAAYAQ